MTDQAGSNRTRSGPGFNREGKLQLPPLIFGATSLGNMFRAIDDEEKNDIVAAWIDSGFSPVVIDTAGKYGAGLSLEVIGRELEALEADPNQVFISNKLGWRRTPLVTPEPTFEPGAWVDLKFDAVQDISYDGILRCWEEGNQLLGKFSAQLVSVHDPDEYLAAATDRTDRSRRMDDILGAYRALIELRDAGQVLATGVGAKNWQTIRELSEHCDFDWVMFANSFTIMQHPPALIELMHSLAARGVTLINSALFHGGFLLGGEFFNYRAVDPQDSADAQMLKWREQFQQCCEAHQISPFNAGVAFGRSHPSIRSIALSSSRADRVESHIQSLDSQVPSEFWLEMKHLHLIDPSYPYV
ncbi:aldo/keto reductase [Aureliella helgolandensis]|uniref:Pyridoxal 4-dehydrogenase n=1 Tax=Aureliella helgolandensis TaxID=2527968 RepID=A0A518G8H2_9BACT|nr:aldo/keto reductase [Aureliella helgolandensis]QDV24885.1 Pyridoxal 4-dehydrogenase [Aureliella helgolandensis]